MNLREPLRTLECSGLHPLCRHLRRDSDCRQQGIHPGEVLMAPRQERESSTTQWPHLPRSPGHFWRNGICSCCPGWVKTGRAQMQPRAIPQAFSWCPLQHAPPFDSRLFFAFSSTSRIEPVKWITVDPGSLRKTNRVRTP